MSIRQSEISFVAVLLLAGTTAFGQQPQQQQQQPSAPAQQQTTPGQADSSGPSTPNFADVSFVED